MDGGRGSGVRVERDENGPLRGLGRMSERTRQMNDDILKACADFREPPRMGTSRAPRGGGAGAAGVESLVKSSS